MSLFAQQGAVRVTRLMKKYGDNTVGSASIQIKRLTGDTIDRVSMERTGGTTATTDLVGIVKNRADQILEGDRAKLEADTVHIDSAFAPLESDILVINGAEKTIDSINTINMGNVVMAYTIKVRK